MYPLFLGKDMLRLLFLLLLIPSLVLADTKIQTKSTCVSISMTDTSATTYAANDNIGGELTFSNLLTDTLSGTVTSVKIASKSAALLDMKLYFYKQDISSTGADDAAYTPSDADNALTQCPVKISSVEAHADNSMAFKNNVGCTITSDRRDVTANIVADGAVVLESATDLTVEVCVLND